MNPLFTQIRIDPMLYMDMRTAYDIFIAN